MKVLVSWPIIGATRLLEVLVVSVLMLVVALLAATLIQMSKQGVPNIAPFVDGMAAVVLLACGLWTVRVLKFRRAPRYRRIAHARQLAAALLVGNQAIVLPLVVFALLFLSRAGHVVSESEVSDVLDVLGPEEGVRADRLPVWHSRIREIGVDYSGEALVYPFHADWSPYLLRRAAGRCDREDGFDRLCGECRVLVAGDSCDLLDASVCDIRERRQGVIGVDECRDMGYEDPAVRRYVGGLGRIIRALSSAVRALPGGERYNSILSTLLLVESVVLTLSLVVEVLAVAGVGAGLVLVGVVAGVIVGAFAYCGSLGVSFTPGIVPLALTPVFISCVLLLLCSHVRPWLYRRWYASLALTAWATIPLVVWQAFVDNEFFAVGTTLDLVGRRFFDVQLLVSSVVGLIAASVLVVVGIRAVDRSASLRPR